LKVFHKLTIFSFLEDKNLFLRIAALSKSTRKMIYENCQ